MHLINTLDIFREPTLTGGGGVTVKNAESLPQATSVSGRRCPVGKLSVQRSQPASTARER